MKCYAISTYIESSAIMKTELGMKGQGWGSCFVSNLIITKEIFAGQTFTPHRHTCRIG